MAQVILTGLSDAQANGIAIAFEKDAVIDAINDELDDLKVEKVQFNENIYDIHLNNVCNVVSLTALSDVEEEDVEDEPNLEEDDN